MCLLDDCKGCKISKASDDPGPRHAEPIGGAIKLGGWVLNHYGGPEGFLGWMALQPYYHRMEYSELSSPEEVGELGGHLQWVSSSLEEYWKDTFPDDRLERVYVIYMFESAFDWPPSEYHLHLHLIARPRSLGRLLRSKPAASIDAWQMAGLTGGDDFPHEYVRNRENVEALMGWLQNRRANQ